MDDVTYMLLADTIDNFGAWILFIGTLIGLVALLFVGIFLFRLAVWCAVRSIRRRFIEGRV